MLQSGSGVPTGAAQSAISGQAMKPPASVAREISYANSATTRAGRVVIRSVENLTGRLKLIRMARDYDREVAAGRNFWEVMVERYGLSVELMGGSFDAIPASGPLVVISNHPYGILDGLILGLIPVADAGRFPHPRASGLPQGGGTEPGNPADQFRRDSRGAGGQHRDPQGGAGDAWRGRLHRHLPGRDGVDGAQALRAPDGSVLAAIHGAADCEVRARRSCRSISRDTTAGCSSWRAICTRPCGWRFWSTSSSIGSAGRCGSSIGPSARGDGVVGPRHGCAGDDGFPAGGDLPVVADADRRPQLWLRVRGRPLKSGPAVPRCYEGQSLVFAAIMY